jgi:Rps23 Pro-64 3,4-dihydroxylase Tpa1-like proline 4-hydroxylase
VYLNETWQYNDGGMFNWLNPENNEWKNIEPTFNKAVVNDSGYSHGITPVKSSSNRITLQVFLSPLI